jgi:hypothetical protein
MLRGHDHKLHFAAIINSDDFEKDDLILTEGLDPRVPQGVFELSEMMMYVIAPGSFSEGNFLLIHTTDTKVSVRFMNLGKDGIPLEEKKRCHRNLCFKPREPQAFNCCGRMPSSCEEHNSKVKFCSMCGKKVSRCPSCHTIIPKTDDTVYCNKCRFVFKCPKCNARIMGHKKFCSKCGYDFQ